MAKPLPYDLTVAPIPVGAYMVIETHEHRHNYLVEHVEGEPGSMRKVHVRRISSSDPGVPLKDVLTLHPGQPLLGLVVPEAEFERGDEAFYEDAGAINNLIVSELYNLLSSNIQAGNQLQYKDAIDLLVKQGAMPRQRYEKNRTWLSRLIKANTDIFVRKGPYVKLTNKKNVDNVQAHEPSSNYIEVSRYHLNKMIEHALLSGLFTGGRPVRLVDKIHED